MMIFVVIQMVRKYRSVLIKVTKEPINLCVHIYDEVISVFQLIFVFSCLGVW